MLKLGITAISALIGISAGVAVILARRKNISIFPKKVIGDIDCDESFKATKFGGKRDTSKLRLVVLHSSESSNAKGTAGWFANPASQGSTHLVIDDKECYRTLQDDVIPWGAKGGDSNKFGLHVEMVGFAKWTRAEWLSHPEMLDKIANAVNYWCNKYDIPLTFLSVEDLKEQGLNARGITTHVNLAKAFGLDTHWDPGPGFPLDVLMEKAGAEYKMNPYV